MSNIFTDQKPNLEEQWRAIVLFGANVASYKFALAKSLLEISPADGDIIKLEDLAVPFAKNITEHLKTSDTQATSASSKFLDVCRSYNLGDVTENELREKSTKLGFVNVIDAFHTVNRAPIPDLFFIDERKINGGIRITANFSKLLELQKGNGLSCEVESRWRLVETAWNLGISRNLVNIDYDLDEQSLITFDKSKRRVNVTSSRGALNGYQHGKCFYCGCEINISGGSGLTDVDHFFPHTLRNHGFSNLVDGVWNLVLACKNCNRGTAGKFAHLPTTRLLKKLHDRNEFLILSHHPLRETIMRQTGATADLRLDFLKRWYKRASSILIHSWEP